MSAEIISLSPDVLDAHLVTFEGYVQELNANAEEVWALVFGLTGDNESAGPCAGRANDLNTALHDVCVSVSSVIEKSVVHLKNIRDDIIASQ